MVDRVEYGEVLSGRQQIINFIQDARKNNSFSVIDVGGSVADWSSSVADVFVDINPVDSYKKQFYLDICEPDSWKIILEYVHEYGKFNFCICTHTLEDIYNPYIVLDNLPKIAERGIITTPSVKTEINFIENLNWSGSLHHRYMFGFKNNNIIIVPKLPIIESIKNRIKLEYYEEIRFWWDSSISYEKFMNNYLGPDVKTVLKNYEDFIKEQE